MYVQACSTCSASAVNSETMLTWSPVGRTATATPGTVAGAAGATTAALAATTGAATATGAGAAAAAGAAAFLVARDLVGAAELIVGYICVRGVFYTKQTQTGKGMLNTVEFL